MNVQEFVIDLAVDIAVVLSLTTAYNYSYQLQEVIMIYVYELLVLPY